MNATEGATRSYASAGDSSAIGVGVGTGVGDGVAVGVFVGVDGGVAVGVGVSLGVGNGVVAGVGAFVAVGDGIAVRVGVAVGTLVMVAPEELAGSVVPPGCGSSVHPIGDIATIPSMRHIITARRLLLRTSPVLSKANVSMFRPSRSEKSWRKSSVVVPLTTQTVVSRSSSALDIPDSFLTMKLWPS